MKKDYTYPSVMIIDDNPVDIYLLKHIFKACNYAENTVTFSAAQNALDFFKKEANEESIPDVIFLDIMMPEMDGFQFLDQFHKLPNYIQNKTKIIMLSSSENKGDVEKSKQYDKVVKYYSKPVTPEELMVENGKFLN